MLDFVHRTDSIIAEYQARLSELAQHLNTDFIVPKATPTGTEMPDLFRMIGIGHAELRFHEVLTKLDDDI